MLRRAVSRSGVGLHSGVMAVLTMAPAPPGSGLRFHTRAGEVPATLAHAHAEPGGTVLTAGAATVRTPEHLLAALSALSIFDAALHLTGGDEVPALDGSARDWVAAIDEAGRDAGPIPSPADLQPARVEAHGGIGVSILDSKALPGGISVAGARRPACGPDRVPPRSRDWIAVVVDFGGDGPRGRLEVPRTEAAFRAEIAWARTFVLARDVERLQAAGRGAGASRDNTLVWPPGPEDRPRSTDEPVRHKLLDAWGDLALVGPATGSLTVVRGSHALHLALLRAAVRTP